MPAILTERTISEATHVAKGLHSAFAGVLQLPPVKGLKAAVLARQLAIGRMTCQRIVKIGEYIDPSPALLGDIPGVNGLRDFLSALQREGTPSEHLADAEAAVDAFGQFLNAVGLSQTNLASALSLHFEATDPTRQLARRTKLFDAASSVMGQSANATISMMAIRLSDHEAFNFEQVAVRGYAGMRASGSAMPIRLPINMAFSDYRQVGGDEAGRAPQTLIESFCSSPLPTIDTREIKEAHLSHIINPDQIPTGEPFDCFAAQHNMWNIHDPGKNKAIWLYLDYPSRRCTFDLYIHSDIERHNTLSGDCHLWGTSLLAPPEDLWMTRLSDQMEFMQLGRGTVQADSASYARHKELTQYMFDCYGWDANEFVGFRCEMEMPIWRSGMCIVLNER